jgi:DNA repair protein RecO (recombination protein O)
MASRFRSHRVEAVVLRRQNMGEADRLLWVFSRSLGKKRAMAKGVRKMRSRKAGHLEPFTRVSLLLAEGRDLYIITQAEAIDLYLNLRTDLERLGYAAYVVELLDRFTYEEGENQGLYRLLVDTLSRLDQSSQPAFAVRYYEVRLLDLIGFRPHLFHCASCSEAIQPEDQFFSAQDGGVLCPTCGRGRSGVRPISVEGLRVLRHMQRSTFKQAQRLALKDEVDLEVEQIMHHYVTYLLERSLNTPNFLRRVKSNKF